MILIRAALALSMIALGITGLSVPEARAQANAQQSLMTTCNANAATQHLAGADRKTFMSACLSGKPTAASMTPGPAPMTPQQRMTSCNAQAGTQSLAGNARKSFMSSCLKAS